MTEKRRPGELPAAIARDGWQYHHLGIPHTVPRVGEQHLSDLGLHVCGFETSPYGIEWMRFEPHCRIPDIVKTVPHVAFAVDDLDEALKGKAILIAPTAPPAGVRVAFILDDGAPVELLQFDKAAGAQGKWHEGIERPYRAGEEYVVFLAKRDSGFDRLAGPSLAFRVRGELVSLGGFAGVQGSISLNEVSELLDRLSRNAPLEARGAEAGGEGGAERHVVRGEESR